MWPEILDQKRLVATDVPEEEVAKAVTGSQHVTLQGGGGRGEVRVGLCGGGEGPWVCLDKLIPTLSVGEVLLQEWAWPKYVCTHRPCGRREVASDSVLS